MELKAAYNIWADQYDSNQNKTRDLEAISLMETLSELNFSSCLEIGCGTGKNTAWLVSKVESMVAVDLSDKMLATAKSKIKSANVKFIQADINSEWDFLNEEKFDLTTFSLVLEHIEDLNKIFEKLKKVVRAEGYVYIGELHPFKQYSGTKARFETADGLQIVTCFTHHISDFTLAASKTGFRVLQINEYFDEDDRNNIPRILTLLLQKEAIN